MSEEQPNSVFFQDRFAVAEVALYIFAALQVYSALMVAVGAAPLGLPPQATILQRISVTTHAVFSILGFAVGYALLGRYLKQSTRVVWRLASAVFLTNIALSVLTIVAQPGPFAVLTCCLSAAGFMSLWTGRKAVRPQ